MSQQYTKKQHYVPQCYLKRFATNGQVFVVNRHKHKTHSGNIRDVASKKHFYEAEELKINAVEHALGQRESQYSRTLDKFVDRFDTIWNNPTLSLRDKDKRIRSILTNSEQRQLIHFISLQLARTPKARESTASLLKWVEITPESAKLHTLLSLKNGWDWLALGEFLRIFRLSFVSAPQGCEFWTSDEPVVVTTIRGNNGLLTGYGWICFPLSPNLLIQLKHPAIRDYNPIAIQATPEQMASYNKLQVLNATQVVIANKEYGDQILQLMTDHPQVPSETPIIERVGLKSLSDVSVRYTDHRPPEGLRVPSAQEMVDTVTDHIRRELGDEAARDPQIIWRRFFELAVIALLRTHPSLAPAPHQAMKVPGRI